MQGKQVNDAINHSGYLKNLLQIKMIPSVVKRI